MSHPLGEPSQSGRPLITGPVTYAIVPEYGIGHALAGQDLSPAGRAGQYKVTDVLAVPGRNVVQTEVNFDALRANGDSLLAVGPEVASLDLEMQEDGRALHVTIGVNQHRRLRNIEVDLDALSFEDAERRGYDLIMPVLSRWSFLHDVAITTCGRQIEEVATGVRRFQTNIAGAVKGFSDLKGSSTPEHRLLLAAYREGLSSAEPLWQALSIYRVAEGVWALRAARRAGLLVAGQPVREPRDRVPSDLSQLGHPRERDCLVVALRPYVGRTFRAVFDDLRDVVRNPIAHLDPDGNPLQHDSWDDIQKVQRALPGLRWIARQLLAAELNWEDGPSTNDIR